MIGKIAGLARALAVLLAIVAGFVAIPNLDVGLVLVVLGLIAGLSVAADLTVGLAVVVLVLPVVASALGTIPAIGTQLGAVATNLAMFLAGSVATIVTIATFNHVKGDLAGLGSSS